MRLAWFTPLPPMPSGIADYSTELVPYVAERAQVTVYCPRPKAFRRPQGPPGISVRDPHEYFAAQGDGRRYDATFYHLGNNPYHEFVYRAARLQPQIAVFHDAVLHHLIAHVTIEQGRDPGRYEGIMYAEHGHLGTRLAMLRRGGVATEFEKFLFPLTAHVATRAKGIVVHSEDSALRMREIAPDVPLARIPHHAGLPPEEVRGIGREEARDRLGLPQDAFVVGHFGFITKPKQPAAVVAGFAEVHREFPDAVLLMVGADHTGGALARLIEHFGITDAVRRVGYVDLVDFYLHLRASDAVVNLRYPSAGESSGTFARALAEGRAVIVNNYASFAEIPGDVSLKVEIDRPQPPQVAEHLLALARDPGARRGVESRARRYAETYLDPVRCRDLYLRFAEQVGTREVLIPEITRPRYRRGPVTFADTKTEHERIRVPLEDVLGDTLTTVGDAAYIDALYRLILRRPAEDEAIRAAHAELAGGGRLTRGRLVERMLESREFAEVRLLDDLLRDLEVNPRAFTLWEDAPFGPDTTERLIEIPWMLSRWRGERRVLDVGYAYASLTWLSGLLDLPIPSLHGIDMATLSVPHMHRVRADVRSMPYRDNSFDLIYCVSTIEHIGRDNTRYGLPPEPPDPDADGAAMLEMARVLAPFGRLMVSVPLGRREDHGWFTQYDIDGWNALLRRTPFEVQEQEHFKLTPEGWVWVKDARTMGLLSYGDGVPAAKGVLCAVLVKRNP
ncbi:MAG: methyltransferase domain-containing protein [Actinobacteria bacterium]|nr:methyltransferase domain-containing protein [Actinomycetota bacterium]